MPSQKRRGISVSIENDESLIANNETRAYHSYKLSDKLVMWTELFILIRHWSLLEYFLYRNETVIFV